MESLLFSLERLIASAALSSSASGNAAPVVSAATTHADVPALPGLRVDGKPIGLPLNEGGALALRKFVGNGIATGMGGAAITGSSCFLPAALISVANPAWAADTMPAIIAHARKALGVPCGVEVRAELSHLLITSPSPVPGASSGGMDPSVADAGDGGSDFAILEVVLPSVWEGGELRLSHGKQSWSFGCAAPNMYQPQSIAHFLEVARLLAAPTSGYRASLLYRLRTVASAGDAPVLRAPAPDASPATELAAVALGWARALGMPSEQQASSPAAQAAAAAVAASSCSLSEAASVSESNDDAASSESLSDDDDAPGRIAIVLKHVYRGCGLAPDDLTGASARLAAWAREAASKAPGAFVPYLALLQVRQVGDYSEKSSSDEDSDDDGDDDDDDDDDNDRKRSRFGGSGDGRRARKRARMDGSGASASAGADDESSDESSDDDGVDHEAARSARRYDFDVESDGSTHVLTCWTRLTDGERDALPDELLLRPNNKSYSDSMPVDETGSFAWLPRTGPAVASIPSDGRPQLLHMEEDEYAYHKYGQRSGRFRRWWWRAVLVLDFRACSSPLVQVMLSRGLTAAAQQLCDEISAAVTSCGAELATARRAYDARPRPWDASSYPQSARPAGAAAMAGEPPAAAASASASAAPAPVPTGPEVVDLCSTDSESTDSEQSSQDHGAGGAESRGDDDGEDALSSGLSDDSDAVWTRGSSGSRSSCDSESLDSESLDSGDDEDVEDEDEGEEDSAEGAVDEEGDNAGQGAGPVGKQEGAIDDDDDGDVAVVDDGEDGSDGDDDEEEDGESESEGNEDERGASDERVVQPLSHLPDDHAFGFVGCEVEAEADAYDPPAALMAGASAEDAPPAIAAALRHAAGLLSAVAAQKRAREQATGLPCAKDDKEERRPRSAWDVRRSTGGRAPRNWLATIARMDGPAPVFPGLKLRPEPYYLDSDVDEEDGDGDDNETEDGEGKDVEGGNSDVPVLRRFSPILASMLPYSQCLIIAYLRSFGHLLDAPSLLILVDACGARPDVIDALLWPLVCQWPARDDDAEQQYLQLMIGLLQALSRPQSGASEVAIAPAMRAARDEVYSWLVKPLLQAFLKKATARVGYADSKTLTSTLSADLIRVLLARGRVEDVCRVLATGAKAVTELLTNKAAFSGLLRDACTALAPSLPESGALGAPSNSTTSANGATVDTAASESVTRILAAVRAQLSRQSSPLEHLVDALQSAREVHASVSPTAQAALAAWVQDTGAAELQEFLRRYARVGRGPETPALFPLVARFSTILPQHCVESALVLLGQFSFSQVQDALGSRSNLDALQALTTSVGWHGVGAAVLAPALRLDVDSFAQEHISSEFDVVTLLRLHDALSSVAARASAEAVAEVRKLTRIAFRAIAGELVLVTFRETSNVAAVVSWLGKHASECAAVMGGDSSVVAVAGAGAGAGAGSSSASVAAAADGADALIASWVRAILAHKVRVYPHAVLLSWASKTLLLPGSSRGINETAVSTVRAASPGIAAVTAVLARAVASQELVRLEPRLRAATGAGGASLACPPSVVDRRLCEPGCDKAAGQGAGTCDAIAAFLRDPTCASVELRYANKSKCAHVYGRLRKAQHLLHVDLSPVVDDKVFTITKDSGALVSIRDSIRESLEAEAALAKALQRAADKIQA